MKKVLLVLAVLMAMATTASADCICMCVQNEKQWVCENTFDVPAGWCGGPCY